MTKEEFDNEQWCINTEVIYNAIVCRVVGVDFSEGLIAIINKNEDIKTEPFVWVRFENVKFC